MFFFALGKGEILAGRRLEKSALLLASEGRQKRRAEFTSFI
jgi:hypothetical protein